MSVIEETQTSRHSFWTYVSFGTYNILWTIPVSTMDVFMFFYYHTVIGLAPIWILLCVFINTIWDSFNDPLIGWLTDRNFKWTKKWGRRFPWIAIGFIPQSLALIMIFSAPQADPTNPLPIMLWLILSFFLYDLFITLVNVHVAILRADKFRTELERRKFSGSWGVFEMTATVIGMMLPPLLLFFGPTRLSYTVMASILSLITIIFGITFLPGAREDKTIIDRYYSRDYKPLKVFKGLRLVLKQKSFTALYAAYIAFLCSTTIIIAMVSYTITFVMRSDNPDVMTLIYAVLLLGTLISIPIWLKILKKLNNNKKTYLIGSFVLCCFILPLTFFQTYIDLMIIAFLTGFGTGCVLTIGIPVLYSNTQDDFVVRTGKNQKGILVGTWEILGLLTSFIDEALITLVFTLTGFNAGLKNYTALVASGANVNLVIWGIRLLLGVIPMLVLLAGTLVFWKFYPLTQEKVLENKAKLKKLGF
ncbi:MAG: MFS transporter [Promethearchaeota archaeon]